MVSRLMLNLHELADIGIYSTAIPFTNTSIDYTLRSDAVELDTLYSDDILHNVNTPTSSAHGFRADDSIPPWSTPARGLP
jgi:hypothetical protein